MKIILSRYQFRTNEIGLKSEFKICFVLIFHLYITQPVQSQTFQSLRYNEDYSYLKNDSSSSKWFNKFKYLPINPVGDSYLSFGGELRYQYNLFRNEDWGELEADRNGFLLIRNMLHANLAIKNYLRVFTQFKANLETGRANGPRFPTDEDQLSLHQLFVDFSINIDTGKRFVLRTGRQELLYGSQRLVSVREGPNNRQSFDAAKIIYQQNNFNADLFYSNPITTNVGKWDDLRRRDIDFFGLYTVSNKVPVFKNVDLYYLGIKRNTAVFNEGSSREFRNSIGTRVWNKTNYWMYDIEALYQFGTFGSGNIRAYTASINTSYTFNDSKWKPSFGFKSEIISGDKTKGDGNLQTFNPLFPRGAYFGLAALIGPANLMDIHPSFSLEPSDKIAINADYDLFWRHRLNDGLYGPVGNFIRSDNNSKSRFIGQQVVAQIELQWNKYFYLAPEAGYFIAGDYLKESGDGKNMFLFAINATLKF